MKFLWQTSANSAILKAGAIIAPAELFAWWCISMTLSEAILVRKTIRSYRLDQPVEQSIQDELVDFLSDLDLPDGSIDWNFDLLPFDEMCKVVGATPRLQAPHYLILRSEKKNGCLQNCGFLGQMAILWLTARGIATCWQGALELENDYDGVLPYIAAIGFGYSDESFYKPGDKKPSPLAKMAFGDVSGYKADLIAAMGCAPSFRDDFPVRVYAEQFRIHFFRKKPRIQLPQLSYMACIDVGVAAAHLYVAAQAAGYALHYEKQQPEPVYRKHHKYQFTALLSSHG